MRRKCIARRRPSGWRASGRSLDLRHERGKGSGQALRRLSYRSAGTPGWLAGNCRECVLARQVKPYACEVSRGIESLIRVNELDSAGVGRKNPQPVNFRLIFGVLRTQVKGDQVKCFGVAKQEIQTRAFLKRRSDFIRAEVRDIRTEVTVWI